MPRLPVWWWIHQFWWFKIDGLVMQVTASSGVLVPAEWTTAESAVPNPFQRILSNSMILTCLFIIHIYGIDLCKIFITEDWGGQTLLEKPDLIDLPQLSVFAEWKSHENPSVFKWGFLSWKIHCLCLEKTEVLESDFVIPKENNNITLLSKGKWIKRGLFRQQSHFSTSLPLVAGLLLPHHHSWKCISLGMPLNFLLWLTRKRVLLSAPCPGEGGISHIVMWVLWGGFGAGMFVQRWEGAAWVASLCLGGSEPALLQCETHPTSALCRCSPCRGVRETLKEIRGLSLLLLCPIAHSFECSFQRAWRGWMCTATASAACGFSLSLFVPAWSPSWCFRISAFMFFL